MTLIRKITESQQVNNPVRLFLANDETLDCVVLSVTDEILIVYAITDFEFDGFIAIKTDSVVDLRCDNHEQLELNIMKSNNEIMKLQNCSTPEATTFSEVVNYLCHSKIWPGFEIQEKKSTVFYAGPIKSVESTFFVVKTYDDTGNWEETYKLYYADIHKVVWNNRYLTNFNNYMKTTIS